MIARLLDMDVNSRIIEWIHSFLTNRPQRVRISGATSQFLSDEVRTNTGAPQGHVLSPALFTLYFSDCRCDKESVLQVKFSDDTSLAGMITGDKSIYRTAVKDLVSWCDDNFLCLNVSKTKEMVIDFRKNASALNPLAIIGEQVEFVHQYKYLGTTLGDKLVWAENTATRLKKAN